MGAPSGAPIPATGPIRTMVPLTFPTGPPQPISAAGFSATTHRQFHPVPSARPPILYLRSCLEDKRGSREDEELQAVLQARGPFIAIGRTEPVAPTPRSGATLSTRRMAGVRSAISRKGVRHHHSRRCDKSIESLITVTQPYSHPIPPITAARRDAQDCPKKQSPLA